MQLDRNCAASSGENWSMQACRHTTAEQASSQPCPADKAYRCDGVRNQLDVFQILRVHCGRIRRATATRMSKNASTNTQASKKINHSHERHASKVQHPARSSAAAGKSDKSRAAAERPALTIDGNELRPGRRIGRDRDAQRFSCEAPACNTKTAARQGIAARDTQHADARAMHGSRFQQARQRAKGMGEAGHTRRTVRRHRCNAVTDRLCATKRQQTQHSNAAE